MGEASFLCWFSLAEDVRPSVASFPDPSVEDFLAEGSSPEVAPDVPAAQAARSAVLDVPVALAGRVGFPAGSSAAPDVPVELVAPVAAQDGSPELPDETGAQAHCYWAAWAQPAPDGSSLKERAAS